MNITINEAQIKELEAYLMEIPAKFANPILQFIGKLASDQNPQAETKED